MTITVPVYLTDSNRAEYLRATTAQERLAKSLLYFGPLDMSNYWTKLGTAEVTVTWAPESNIREAELASVDSQIEQIEKAARQEINRLREYRSTLLCLEYTPEVSE